MSNKSNPFGNIAGIINDNGLMNELMKESDRFEIELDKILINEQVRKAFDGESIRELSESIADVGVLQNIIVNKAKDGFYSLIAGERRVMASEQAGKTTIPALVLDVDEETQRKIQLLENIQRENLSAVELAEELKTMLEQLDGDQDALAAHYNKSRAWVSKAMRMNELTGAAAEAMTVTSDQEALLAIQQLEQIEPEKAAALVDEIKTDFGKTNTRKKAQDELRTVKDDKKAEAEQEKAIKKQEKKKAKKPRKEEQIDLLPGSEEPAPEKDDGTGPDFDASHPFYAGTNPAGLMFHYDAENRIRAVEKMDMATLNLVEDVPGVQKSVLAAVQKRRNELMKKLPGEPRKKTDDQLQDAFLKGIDEAPADGDAESQTDSVMDWLDKVNGGDEPSEADAPAKPVTPAPLALVKSDADQDTAEPEDEEKTDGIMHRIYSQEKGKYWLHSQLGYTDDVGEAGQFNSMEIWQLICTGRLNDQTLFVVHPFLTKKE